MKNITEKINLKEKFSYFKKLIWLFILVLIIFNIVLFFLLNWIYYFLALIILNIVLVWLLIPVFIWIGKTYLISESLEVYDDIKEDLISENFWKGDDWKIIKTIKKNK